MALFEGDLRRQATGLSRQSSGLSRMISGQSLKKEKSNVSNKCDDPEELPIVVLGAGMAGLQFACSLADYSSEPCPIIVVESADRPGGKALGIWDDVAQEYDSSLQFFASSLSHRQVIKRAQDVGVDIYDGPHIFHVTKATADYYETTLPGPSAAELREHRMEVALHRAGFTKKPCLKDAVQFYRRHGVDFASEVDFTTKVSTALSAMQTTSQFLRIGGYHHLPPSAKIMKCAFDFESCRLLLPGKTEEFALGLTRDAVDQGVTFEFSTVVVGVETNVRGDVRSVLVEGSGGEQKRIKCKAVVNTFPVRTFTSMFQRQDKSENEEACDLKGAEPQCVKILSKASFHLYRGWLLEVERPRPDLYLVLDWVEDRVDNNATGRVVGLGNSMKTAGVVGCLQIGQVTSMETLQPDHPDEFYMEKVREVCQRAGLGNVTRVRGKAVWSMAPYLGKENACAVEKLQGHSNIFHCSDYLFLSSLSHSMCYAARLAKRVAITQGYYKEPCANSLCSGCGVFLRDLREWSSFEASLARDRESFKHPPTVVDTADKNDTDTVHASKEQRASLARVVKCLCSSRDPF